MATKKLIRFDWAMKRILRDKANFDILEGFLSELLREDVKILQILDSESNKEDVKDKFNRVDLLIENSKKELIIIEIQDTQEYDYFQRILYGTSKVIAEHIESGNKYEAIRKVISITIAYFDLGHGEDYVYHGTTVFRGIHKNDMLTLSKKQIKLYNKMVPQELYPEYWILKVGEFDGVVKDKLDEWMYFLKTAELQPKFSAKGLKAASEKLDSMQLSDDELKVYRHFVRRLSDIASYENNRRIEREEFIEKLLEEKTKEAEEKGMEKGMEKGEENKTKETILKLHHKGKSTQEISDLLDLSVEYITQILQSAK